MAAADLHVEAHGSGPAVVLAHGFAGSARNFRPLVRALRDRFRVVVYDARGHARSAAPGDPAAYRLDAAVADFASAAERAGPRPFVAGGLSMGAAVALHFALAHPERVRGLVLASFPAGPASGRGIAGEALRFAEAIEREGLEAAGARFVWGPHAGLDRSSAALVRRGFLEHAPVGLVQTLRELLAALPPLEDLAPRLRRLDVPALVVAGARDAASLPVCRELAELLPRGRLVEIPEAGHVVNLARPEAFQAAVRSFLDEIALE